MGSAVPLRDDFDAAALRSLARQTRDANQGRRLLVLAAIYDGGSRGGSRPRAPHDQRTRSAYIFGAICPQEGKGAGLVLPFCNSAAMALHLEEISHAVAPGAHAVLVMDQAGWHTSAKLNVPANITILTLPPRAPELNPSENIWQFLRDNWLSNRVFSSHDDIVDHCCDAWNKLVDQPWKIMSIGHQEWAHRL